MVALVVRRPCPTSPGTRRSGRCDRPPPRVTWPATASSRSARRCGSTPRRACTRSTRGPTGLEGFLELEVGDERPRRPRRAAEGRALAPRRALVVGQPAGGSRAAAADRRRRVPDDRRAAHRRCATPATTAATSCAATSRSAASRNSYEDEMTIAQLDDEHAAARGPLDVRHPRLRHGAAADPDAPVHPEVTVTVDHRRQEGGLIAMCLGIPGQLVELLDRPRAPGPRRRQRRRPRHQHRAARGRAPRAGDWVLIHVGFAMSKIDEDEAQRAPSRGCS